MNCIKNSLFYFLIPLLFISLLHPHSGRTDASGGHKDNINGGYHFHHGMNAHQHPEGVCESNSSENIGIYIFYAVAIFLIIYTIFSGNGFEFFIGNFLMCGWYGILIIGWYSIIFENNYTYTERIFGSLILMLPSFATIKGISKNGFFIE
jgi:hypothetical protein